MIRWILIVARSAGRALVLVLAIVGSLLPRNHRASSRITLRQPAEAIWLVISDPGAVPGWWPEITEARGCPDPRTAGRDASRPRRAAIR